MVIGFSATLAFSLSALASCMKNADLMISTNMRRIGGAWVNVWLCKATSSRVSWKHSDRCSVVAKPFTSYQRLINGSSAHITCGTPCWMELLALRLAIQNWISRNIASISRQDKTRQDKRDLFRALDMHGKGQKGSQKTHREPTQA